jgi:RNA polymerase-binding transcription factor DksA
MKAGDIKKRLLELRAETLAEGPARIEPNRKDVSAVGVADEDEQALSEMMQTLASQRNRKQAELVKQIDRALARLSSHPDLIGLCEECEEEIPEKRLKLMPYASLCAGCQAKHDPQRGVTRRSITDYE